MNCQEALNLLYDIIDKEASEIDSKEVQLHLERCQDCFQKYHLEESVRELLEERLKNSFDVPKVDHLKAKVIAKLDELDEQRTAIDQSRFPLRVPSVALAAAASFVLLVGAAFFAADIYSHYVEYIPLERAHWQVENDVNLINDIASTQVVMASVNTNYGFSMAEDCNGLSLVGGREAEIKGMNVAHFVYSDRNNAVSVFVVPASEVSFADDLIETRIEIDGDCYYDHNCRGCRLVYHKEGDAIIITASTDRSFDLLEFDPASRTI